jgi:hypothetical protein
LFLKSAEQSFFRGYMVASFAETLTHGEGEITVDAFRIIPKPGGGSRD